MPTAVGMLAHDQQRTTPPGRFLHQRLAAVSEAGERVSPGQGNPAGR
ncbi:hypothetical protein ACFWIW_24610 [Amycolatopsis sp. NPDC058340]